MKKQKIFRGIALFLTLTLSVGIFAGCGNQSDGGEDDVKTVVIGAPASAHSWAYQNEDGELDGFEIAVLKAVDEKLPQYQFDIQGMDFNNVLLSLDTGKIDLGAFLFEYNEERAANYDFGNTGYVDFSTYLLLPADAEDTTIAGLSGKVVGLIQEANNATSILKQWNEDHPDQDPIELDFFGQLSDEAVMQSFLEGRWDALVGTYWDADTKNQTFGNGEEVVKRGEALANSLAYYLYPKDGSSAELKAAVDQALEELVADGTIREISERYFGYDVSPNHEG